MTRLKAFDFPKYSKNTHFEACFRDTKNARLQRSMSKLPTIQTGILMYSNKQNYISFQSVSIIFSNNGLAGINFEHAWGDGVAIMRFFDDLLNDNFKNAYVTDDNVHSFDVNVQEINFSTSDDIKETIKIAKSQHFSHVDSLEFRPFRREGFGKIDCKRAKIGPDALMQLAFQISHLNMKGRASDKNESRRHYQ